MAQKMADAGIKTPVAHGGLGWTDTQWFELILSGMSADAYKRAIMQLDDKALRGPEVLAAFKELRRVTGWMNPANAGQHWSVFIPNFMRGEYGLLLMHGGASGVLKRANFEEGRDYLCGAAPNDNAKPVFDMNVDSIIFWDTKDPDLLAGQKIDRRRSSWARSSTRCSRSSTDRPRSVRTWTCRTLPTRTASATPLQS